MRSIDKMAVALTAAAILSAGPELSTTAHAQAAPDHQGHLGSHKRSRHHLTHTRELGRRTYPSRTGPSSRKLPKAG
jgi:hypothetical protein